MLNKQEAESTKANRGNKETGRDSSIDSGHSKSTLSTLTALSSEDNGEAEVDGDTNMVLVAEEGGLQEISGVPQFGRPKGSTKTRSREAKDCISLATKEAAKQYQVLMARNQKENGGRSRLTRGTLTSIIATAKEMYNVEESHSICETTIRSRYRRNNLSPLVQQGTPSPMLSVEPHLVALIVQLARMRCPINVRAALQLANSLIAGTSIADEIVAWKLEHNIQTRRSILSSAACEERIEESGDYFLEDDSEREPSSELATSVTATTPPLLGLGYWRGFMRRNGHIIKSKRAIKFESKRAEWCTYANFEEMYNKVYKEMVKGGIATELATEAR